MVCDTVHHDYPGSCPSVFQGFPAELADHLTDITSGHVVPTCKSYRPALDSFQLLHVGFCVWVTWCAGILQDRPN